MRKGHQQQQQQKNAKIYMCLLDNDIKDLLLYYMRFLSSCGQKVYQELKHQHSIVMSVQISSGNRIFV